MISLGEEAFILAKSSKGQSRQIFPDAVAAMGIDIGKNTFHLIGLDKRGTIVMRVKALADARAHAAWLGVVPKQEATGDHSSRGPLRRCALLPCIDQPAVPRQVSMEVRTFEIVTTQTRGTTPSRASVCAGSGVGHF